jgi:hypothetical protein
LSQVIALTPAEIEHTYHHFRASFDRVSKSPFRDDYVRLPVGLVNSALVGSALVQHAGTDLPCWLEASPTAHRLIILGQDPLRDDRYFSTEDGPAVVIGTPYSTHSASLRERGNSARYWKIVRHLIGAGHSLYLTDVSKFWARDHRVPPSAEPVYRALFQSEQDLISRPGSTTVVVAFGRRAAEFALGRKCPDLKIGSAKAELRSTGSATVLPVLHPSPQNEGILNAYLRANDVDPAMRVMGIAEVITKTIAQL